MTTNNRVYKRSRQRSAKNKQIIKNPGPMELALAEAKRQTKN